MGTPTLRSVVIRIMAFFVQVLFLAVAVHIISEALAQLIWSRRRRYGPLPLIEFLFSPPELSSPAARN